MRLPPQFQHEFVAEFKREPLIVLRAICDLTGEEGLAWIACDGFVLACFSKPAGGEFTRHTFRIAEATVLELGVEEQVVAGRKAEQAEANMLLLHARFPEMEFVVRLPASEEASLQKLVELLPSIDSVNTVRPPASLTPHLCCAAAVYAFAQADGELPKEELDWVVARFGNQQSFRRGGAWLLKHGFAKLLVEAATLLTLGQRESLVVNLLDLGFCDSRLTSQERTMLEEWQQLAGMSVECYQRCFDTLVAAASLGSLVRETAAGPETTGLNLLCAGLLGVVQHRPETAERRIKALERRVHSTDAINSGQTYLEQIGPEGLVTAMLELLDPAQRRCVLANVMDEAFQGGAFTVEVANYVRLVSDGLGVSAVDFETDLALFRQLGAPELFRETT